MKRLSIVLSILALGWTACKSESTPPIAQSMQNKMTEDTAVAIFASGCFWGTEYYMKRIEGVLETMPGYTGGHVDNPTYEEVCSKTTGHYEAVRVTYDPSVVDYETLAKWFFETHDPTQANGQGPDIGPQYRSAIFVQNEAEREIANKLINQLELKGLKIATEVKDAATFWPAELYHQDYYDNKGGTPYCHSYRKLF